jgi:CRISPR-associated exonuclease Cas4
MSYKTHKELEPVQVSALEHYSYCPRQCALIHLEHVWDENVFTMRGRDVHERVDEASSHVEAGVRVERALPIWSKRLNLVGKADAVEFRDGIPYPVEYKSGRHRRGHSESLQLCAQAVCLEEMFGVKIDKGALYWHGSRERKEIALTDALKAQVREVSKAVHRMIAQSIVPPPVNDERCRDCSLREACLPDVVDDKKRCHSAAECLFVVESE